MRALRHSALVFGLTLSAYFLVRKIDGWVSGLLIGLALLLICVTVLVGLVQAAELWRGYWSYKRISILITNEGLEFRDPSRGVRRYAWYDISDFYSDRTESVVFSDNKLVTDYPDDRSVWIVDIGGHSGRELADLLNGRREEALKSKGG